MVRFFDKRIRELMEEVDRMVEKLMELSNLEKVKFKKFGREDFGPHAEVGIFDLMEHELFESEEALRTPEEKVFEVDKVEKEEEPRKLALRRFEERKKEAKK